MPKKKSFPPAIDPFDENSHPDKIFLTPQEVADMVKCRVEELSNTNLPAASDSKGNTVYKMSDVKRYIAKSESLSFHHFQQIKREASVDNYFLVQYIFAQGRCTIGEPTLDFEGYGVEMDWIKYNGNPSNYWNDLRKRAAHLEAQTTRTDGDMDLDNADTPRHYRDDTLQSMVLQSPYYTELITTAVDPKRAFDQTLTLPDIQRGICSVLNERLVNRIEARLRELPVNSDRYKFNQDCIGFIENWCPEAMGEGIDSSPTAASRFIALVNKALKAGQQDEAQLWEWKKKFRDFSDSYFSRHAYKSEDFIDGAGSGNGLEWRRNPKFRKQRSKKSNV